MMKKSLWLAYDFGIKGDYTGLYTWLDNQNAKECGTGLAYFIYNYNSTSSKFDEKAITQLKEQLKANIQLSKSDRLYLIWKDKENDKIKGEFINGARKQSPWKGYGELGGNENRIDEEV